MNPTPNDKLLCATFFIFSWVIISCTTSKTLAVDKNLYDNSNHSLAKTKSGLFGMARASFGDYKTVEFSKVDSPTLKYKSDKFFSVHLFRYNSSTQKRKAYTMTMIHGQDSVTANMFIWFNVTTSEPGFFSKKTSEVLRSTKDAFGEIYSNKNEQQWTFSISQYGLLASAGSAREVTFGYLKSEADSLSIRALKDFTVFDKQLDYVRTKGISIDDASGASIAALQLLGSKNVWIRKDLPSALQLTIAAIFSVILGSQNQ